MHVDADGEVRADGLAHRLEIGDAFADGLDRIDHVVVSRDEAALAGAPAFLFGLEPALGVLLGRRTAAGMDVHQRLVASLAADELVDRLAERLAEDVPQGDLDGGDRRVEDRAASPARPAIHRLPVHLDVGRIAADQIAVVLVDGGLHRPRLRGHRAFSDADDALVGVDLAVDVVLAGGVVDDPALEVGDLEVERLGLLAGLRQQAFGAGESGEPDGGRLAGQVEEVAARQLGVAQIGVGQRGFDQHGAAIIEPRRDA